MTKYLTLLVLGLMACGDERGEPKSDAKEAAPSYTMALESRDGLPKCDELNERQLVYIEDEALFYACRKSVWTAIKTIGEKGDKGEQGEPGESVVADDNVFYDSFTGMFVTLPVSNIKRAQAGLMCEQGAEEGWRLPDLDEVEYLVARGAASGSIWLNEMDQVSLGNGLTSFGEGLTASRLPSFLAIVVCIRYEGEPYEKVQ